MVSTFTGKIVAGLGAGIVLMAILGGTGCASTPASMTTGGGRIVALSGLPQVDAAIASGKAPFIVFYHSPRCGFCGGMLKGMKRDLPDFGAKALIYTVDIDSNTDVRDSKDIGPVPVVVFYKNGHEVNRWRTFRPAFVVRKTLKKFFQG